jgi:hypothetical protein
MIKYKIKNKKAKLLLEKISKFEKKDKKCKTPAACA